MPNDLLGPNPEEVRLWLRFPPVAPRAGSQPEDPSSAPCPGRLPSAHVEPVEEVRRGDHEDERREPPFVSQIAAALPISRPAVSRHLRLLKEAGLVAEQARGTSRIYHLRGEGLRAVQEYLEQVWGDAAQRFRLMAENTPENAG